jgi:hypothetical protein
LSAPICWRFQPEALLLTVRPLSDPVKDCICTASRIFA